MVRRKHYIQRLPPQVHSLDSGRSDCPRNNPKIGQTANNILDDRCAIASPKLNSNIWPSFAKRADERWQCLVDDDGQGRHDDLSALFSRDLAEPANHDLQIVQDSLADP